MDLFTFNPQYHVLVCKSCGYAIAPLYLPEVASHISAKHPNEACREAGLPYSRPRKPAARTVKRVQGKYSILDPAVDT
jgi:hypothetical protein